MNKAIRPLRYRLFRKIGRRNEEKRRGRRRIPKGNLKYYYLLLWVARVGPNQLADY